MHPHAVGTERIPRPGISARLEPPREDRVRIRHDRSSDGSSENHFVYFTLFLRLKAATGLFHSIYPDSCSLFMETLWNLPTRPLIAHCRLRQVVNQNRVRRDRLPP